MKIPPNNNKKTKTKNKNIKRKKIQTLKRKRKLSFGYYSSDSELNQKSNNKAIYIWNTEMQKKKNGRDEKKKVKSNHSFLFIYIGFLFNWPSCRFRLQANSSPFWGRRLQLLRPLLRRLEELPWLLVAAVVVELLLPMRLVFAALDRSILERSTLPVGSVRCLILIRHLFLNYYFFISFYILRRN